MQLDPRRGISILADFRPMGISFHAVVVFGLGKNLLFKSVLGHCGKVIQFEDTLGFVLSFAQKSEKKKYRIVPYQSDVPILLGPPFNVQI